MEENGRRKEEENGKKEDVHLPKSLWGDKDLCLQRVLSGHTALIGRGKTDFVIQQ